MTISTDDFARQPATTTLAELQSDAESGLKGAEVEARLSHYGYNKIEEKEESLGHRVFRRF